HDGVAGEALTADMDVRFTRIGRYLARWKLDELPQLVNVLRGQMSLVGPRPEDPRFVRWDDSDFAEIQRVRPGITGLVQLAFAREAEILDPTDRVGCYIDRILPQKVHLDLLYARTRSIRGDLRILAWTIVPVVLRRDVAVNRRTGSLTVRRRTENVAPSS
ncbi:MAG TPA: sugar transferase, partial [Gaiella sp.]|nr:sugar transferase [Gaiella sp.]